MKLFKVRITSARLETYWYADKMGQEFYVFESKTPFKDLVYEVVRIGKWARTPTQHYIDRESFKFIGEPFEGDIITEVNISIKKK